MKSPFPGFGTVLNAILVALGSLLGLALRAQIKPEWMPTVQLGLGIVTICLGIKMFLPVKNVLIVAAAIALGGLLGAMMGIHDWIVLWGSELQRRVGGGGSFVEGLVTASVLYCIGPMTILGCIQDGVELNSDLLRVKSLMDGLSSIFFAAAYGVGVLWSAAVVLLIQGLLTAASALMRKKVADEGVLIEFSAIGGPILVVVGFGLCNISDVPSANFLPALLIGPMLIWIASRFPKPKEPAVA